MAESHPKGQHTFAEIRRQAGAWQGTLDLVGAKAGSLKSLFAGAHEVVFTGCGSGLNVGCQTAPTFQHFTGVRARAVPAADVAFFPDTALTQANDYVIVLISRSGETTETVLAGEMARSRGLRTLAVTCCPDSALARNADDALILAVAAEKSVTTTQSLTSMVLAGQLLTAHVAGNDNYFRQLRRLPDLGGRLVEGCRPLGKTIAEDGRIRKFAFVANAPLYGLARECQLKIKEMVLLQSDCYPLLDFRHGPKSNVDAHMLVTVLASDGMRAEETVFIKEMKGLGGIILVLCDEATETIRGLADYLVEARSGLSEYARGILYMPVIHHLAYYRSLLEGQDPDNPANLTYWVETPR